MLFCKRCKTKLTEFPLSKKSIEKNKKLRESVLPIGKDVIYRCLKCYPEVSLLSSHD